VEDTWKTILNSRDYPTIPGGVRNRTVTVADPEGGELSIITPRRRSVSPLPILRVATVYWLLCTG
jgi:hypothetical protein